MFLRLAGPPWCSWRLGCSSGKVGCLRPRFFSLRRCRASSKLPTPLFVKCFRVAPVVVHRVQEAQRTVQALVVVPADDPVDHLDRLVVLLQLLVLQGLAKRALKPAPSARSPPDSAA